MFELWILSQHLPFPLRCKFTMFCFTSITAALGKLTTTNANVPIIFRKCHAVGALLTLADTLCQKWAIIVCNILVQPDTTPHLASQTRGARPSISNTDIHCGHEQKHHGRQHLFPGRVKSPDKLTSSGVGSGERVGFSALMRAGVSDFTTEKGRNGGASGCTWA